MTRSTLRWVLAALVALALGHVAEAADEATPETGGAYQARAWPPILEDYARDLEKLEPPMDELRRTFLLFYWAAFGNDVKSGIALIAEEYYDLAKGGMSSRRELEKAANEMDPANPHDGYSVTEKLAVLSDDLRYLKIEYRKLATPRDATKAGLPSDFKHVPGDYCLVVTIYPGDDGTLLVLRVIRGRWTIVAGGPRKPRRKAESPR